jgi:hypothetical protein
VGRGRSDLTVAFNAKAEVMVDVLGSVTLGKYRSSDAGFAVLEGSIE